jgi:hypothetical protein
MFQRLRCGEGGRGHAQWTEDALLHQAFIALISGMAEGTAEQGEGKVRIVEAGTLEGKRE